MQGAVDEDGHLGDGQVVEVAQGEHHPVVGRQPVEDGRRPEGVELGVPRVVEAGLVGGDGAQPPLLPGLAAPVVDELVAGHGHQPLGRDVGVAVAPHGLDRGEERLGGEVLGHGHVSAAAAEQVAVHVGEGVVVEGERAAGPGSFVDGGHLSSHTPTVARPARPPTGGDDYFLVVSDTGLPAMAASKATLRASWAGAELAASRPLMSSGSAS